MKLLFDGLFHTSYSQGYLCLGETYDITEDWRKDQVNGLLGAAFPTFLYLVFGLHTGDVRLTIRLCDSEPKREAFWEEAVEVSFPFAAALDCGSPISIDHRPESSL
ncbi:hypothetical protein OOT46_24075 [Aquabacterium sp. A7-Y]|uniref:hypothetical protein n=1 Tax=Aquabacterium sp. A7-Y TaxID=1349605 RepID=UPI00223DB46C|nr:hypothetical protein [Aquabacterium sp. A7-Y]MCW7540903.1 hypothetical protein [Aquabacterium sp. A7-Y]